VVSRSHPEAARGRDHGKGWRLPHQGLHFTARQLRPHLSLEGPESPLCHQQGIYGIGRVQTDASHLEIFVNNLRRGVTIISERGE
jgi:hypothetical protein